MSAEVSVVIPNWNGLKELKACLPTVLKQSHKSFEVIVVDNGSHDGSVEYLHQNFPDVNVVALPKNRGFAGGVNAGIRASVADYVVLLNNDTTVGRDWLKHLVDGLQSNPEYDFATSKMVYMSEPSKINSAGDTPTVYGVALPIGMGEPAAKYNANKPVFSACGGAAIYKRTMLNELGLFDEKFFAYLEDVDLSFRAQLAGHKCLYVANAEVLHEVSTTSKRHPGMAEFLTGRNTMMYVLKDWPKALRHKYRREIKQARRAWWRLGGPRWKLNVLKSYVSLLRLYPHIRRERKRIHRSMVVSNDYIESFLVRTKPFGGKGFND